MGKLRVALCATTPQLASHAARQEFMTANCATEHTIASSPTKCEQACTTTELSLFLPN